MSEKHSHRITYCCDEAVITSKWELDEAVDVGIKVGIQQERERIKQVVQDWFDYDCDTSEGSQHLLNWIDEGEETSE